MVIALVGLALAMAAGGIYLALDGYSMIVLERGWSLVIAGSTIASLGAVLLGIALAAWRLGQVRAELVRLRERGMRAEPGLPAPPPRIDPVAAAAAGGMVTATRAEPTLPEVSPPAGAATAESEATSPEATSLETFFADASLTDRERRRGSRREDAAQRRAARRGPAEDGAPKPSGAVAAAGAAVSAGLAALRGRRDAAPGGAPDAGKLEPAPPGDELLPDRTGEATSPPAADHVAATAPPAAVKPDEAAAGPLPSEPDEAEGLPDTGADVAEEGPPTVIGTYNSGGNRYIMFSNGSIDAETPDGVFRFSSLEELKAFIAAGGERQG